MFTDLPEAARMELTVFRFSFILQMLDGAGFKNPQKHSTIFTIQILVFSECGLSKLTCWDYRYILLS